MEGQDFFNECLAEADIIITNPPYSNKDDFLERAYILGKPFAFLLPIESLGAKRRGLLYKEYGIQLIIPHERINFIVPSGKKSAWFPTAWFCWQLNLPRDLMFVELERAKNPTLIVQQSTLLEAEALNNGFTKSANEE